MNPPKPPAPSRRPTNAELRAAREKQGAEAQAKALQEWAEFLEKSLEYGALGRCCPKGPEEIRALVKMARAMAETKKEIPNG